MIRMKIPVDDSHPFKKLTMRDPELEVPQGAKKIFGKKRNSSNKSGSSKKKSRRRRS